MKVSIQSVLFKKSVLLSLIALSFLSVFKLHMEFNLYQSSSSSQWHKIQSKFNWKGSYEDFFTSRMNLWHEFANERNCSFDFNDYSRIYSDLHPFTNGIINLTIAKSWNNLEVIEIKNGKAYTSSGKDIFYFKAIHAFEHLLPDMTILVNELDEPRILKNNPKRLRIFSPEEFGFEEKFQSFGPNINGDAIGLLEASCDKSIESDSDLHGIYLGPASFSVSSNKWPIFSFSTIEGCFNDIVIPNFNFYDQDFSISDSLPGWKMKTDQLFWRGTSTGGSPTQDNSNWKKFQRHRLMHKFLENPRDDVNVSFTTIYQNFGHDYLGEEAPKTNREEQYNFKYVVDVDGNVSTERYLALLQHQTLVFKSSIFRDWVIDRVTEWQHYIPIKLDFSDLIEKFEWAKSNIDSAQNIVERANDHAVRNLRKQDMECYSFRLLLEYHRLVKTTK